MNKITLRRKIREILPVYDTEENREELLAEIMNEVYDAFGIPRDDENEDD